MAKKQKPEEQGDESPLAFVSTRELVAELERRHDVAVFIGRKLMVKRGSQKEMTGSFCYRGDPHTAMGLCMKAVRLIDSITPGEVSEGEF